MIAMCRATRILPVVFALLMGGCHLGDQGAARTVLLRIPVRQTAGQPVRLDATSPEVQQAMTDIDAVLSAKGLSRTPNPQTPSPDGTIIHYSGPPTRGCSVSLRDENLAVTFVEFGRGQSTETVKRICDQLRADLSKHYGRERVRVVTAN